MHQLVAMINHCVYIEWKCLWIQYNLFIELQSQLIFQHDTLVQTIKKKVSKTESSENYEPNKLV